MELIGYNSRNIWPSDFTIFGSDLSGSNFTKLREIKRLTIFHYMNSPDSGTASTSWKYPLEVDINTNKSFRYYRVVIEKFRYSHYGGSDRWYGIKCIQISGYKDPSLFPFLGTSNIDSIVYQEDFEDLNYSGSNENGIIVNSDLKNSDYSLRGPNANSFNWVQTTSNSLPTDVSAISFWAKLMIDSSKNPYILEFRDYNNSSVNKELSFYYDISNSRLMLHDQVTPGTSVINTLYINGIRRNIPTTFNASGNEVILILNVLTLYQNGVTFTLISRMISTLRN